MKKLLALLLALAMVFSLAACGQAQAVTREAPAAAEEEAPAEEPAPAETEEPAEPKPEPVGLPAVGDEVNGFIVKEIRDFPLVGGTAVLFEHEKTGAGLVYIANSDTNRVFDLTFFTRAIDNTGLPHVFEHSTLDGSEKYPSKALFFNLSYQTYATYMNAMTQALLTTYPVGSLSEAQLLKYADYYTDSCLHPMILEDESIFREEAWRYRLEDLDDPLTIEGTLYSEMLGALDLSFSSHMNALRTAYPGSTVGNQYGGDPAYIPDMTFESLRNYNELYYHPSNCVGYLYGSFDDYTAILALLDEA
ncbi:MAG: peptidase M16, partial [Oscillospiraceae bacterium]|nr:peptidase M16 [Oscillospiraceae bacterium]